VPHFAAILSQLQACPAVPDVSVSCVNGVATSALAAASSDVVISTDAGPVLPDSDSAEVMELSTTTTASRHHGHRGDDSPYAAGLQGKEDRPKLLALYTGTYLEQCSSGIFFVPHFAAILSQLPAWPAVPDVSKAGILVNLIIM